MTLTAVLLTLIRPAHAQPARPPFLVGWFGGAGAAASLSALPLESGVGANLAVIYNPLETSGETLQTFLDAAAVTSIKVLVQVPEEWIGDRTTGTFKPDEAAIQKFVARFKGHPALYGWYLFDEPEYQQFPTGSQLEGLYALIKASDPDHPVSMSFGDYHCANYGGPSGDSHVPDYVMAADLILFDQYPVFTQAEYKPYIRPGGTDEYHRLEDIPYMVDNCAGYLKAHHTATYQGFVPILQAFKWGSETRYPTYGELRYMVYASLVRDVQGVTFWNNYWNADAAETQKWKQTIGYPLTKEASSLAVVAQNGIYDDPRVVVNRPQSGPALVWTRDLYRYSFAYKFGSDGTNQVLIAVNESRETLPDVQFMLPDSVSAQTAEGLYDGYDRVQGTYQNRTIPLVKGSDGRLTLTDSFTPFQVHVYRFGPLRH